MELKRLTPAGIDLFESWLDRLRDEPAAEVPKELLDDASLSAPAESVAELEPRAFTNRLDWGRYFDRQVSEVPTARLLDDRGLWCWLTVLLFDQVCPRDGHGRRRIGQRARYVPTGSDYKTYYRHLLEGPWRLVRAHRDNPSRLVAILAGSLDRPGELYEQLASRQELATSATVVEAATILYFDAATGRLKRGAGGAGRGSPRRLADVLLQFDLTHDIYSMSPGELIRLLPKEFDRFRPAA